MQEYWKQLPEEQRMTFTFHDHQVYHRLVGQMQLFLEAHPEERSLAFLLDPGTTPLVAELARREVQARAGISVTFISAQQESAAHDASPSKTVATFHERRVQHGISLEQLVADSQLAPWVVEQIDTRATGEAREIDALLDSLSRLSGTTYRRDRLNVGGFTFTLPSVIEQVRVPSQKEEP